MRQPASGSRRPSRPTIRPVGPPRLDLEASINDQRHGRHQGCYRDDRRENQGQIDWPAAHLFILLSGRPPFSAVHRIRRPGSVGALDSGLSEGPCGQPLGSGLEPASQAASVAGRQELGGANQFATQLHRLPKSNPARVSPRGWAAKGMPSNRSSASTPPSRIPPVRNIESLRPPGATGSRLAWQSRSRSVYLVCAL